MKIDTLILGDYQTNCYILRANDTAKDCLIIDTGLDPQPLLNFLNENDLNPIAVILTHGHADHITAVPALKKHFPQIKICIHHEDAEMLTCSNQNLSRLAGIDFSTDSADHLITQEGPIEYAGIKLQIIHTPGHTPGGICLYYEPENLIFTGDTLFADSIGRTDFPSYDMQKCHTQLIESIRSKLLQLPDETTALPGHGPATKIGIEKQHNPHLT